MSNAHADAVSRAADAVRAALGDFTPRVAVVLGSGLGGLTERVASPIRIPYAKIPGFHVPTVLGHKGELVAGTLGGVPVIMLNVPHTYGSGHSA